MSIDLSGLDAKVLGGQILMSVNSEDPLLKMSNLINWEKLYEVIVSDLQLTTGGRFQVGRKLTLRTHLGLVHRASRFYQNLKFRSGCKAEPFLAASSRQAWNLSAEPIH